MRIQDLKQPDEVLIQQAAQVLCEAFKPNWPNAWPTLADALEEVQGFFAADRVTRVAVDEKGTLLGVIGGIEMYDGNVWELHPLAVRPDLQGQGIGRALVTDLEAQVAARGGLTLWLGTDDENGMTSLAGADLYPNILEHLGRLHNLRRHPFEFYQKLGFIIAGVVPDANGPGKPDILMAKRVRK
jgi:aminoglycoside 6'-N-acetyltransferase I